MASVVRIAGPFVSIPGAFEPPVRSLADVVKIPVEIASEVDDHGATHVTAYGSASSVLIDFRDLPSGFDAARAARDCDLLKDMIQSHPETLQELLQAVRAAAHGDGRADHVSALLQKVGLLESSFVARGGGWIWLLVLLAAGCAHLKPYVKPDKPPNKR
jgi:hypothetical protein